MGPKPEYDNAAQLHIGNLESSIRDNDLHKFFQSKGYNIKLARVILNQQDLSSHCSGFLTFYTKEDAMRCMQEMNNFVFKGKPMILNKKKGSEFNTKANIFIKNLHKDLTQNELFDLFKGFGNICSVKLEKHANGKSKGFGFVQFESPEDA